MTRSSAVQCSFASQSPELCPAEDALCLDSKVTLTDSATVPKAGPLCLCGGSREREASVLGCFLCQNQLSHLGLLPSSVSFSWRFCAPPANQPSIIRIISMSESRTPGFQEVPWLEAVWPSSPKGYLKEQASSNPEKLLPLLSPCS